MLVSDEISESFFHPNFGNSFLKKSKTSICFSEVLKVSLPSQPSFLENIIDSFLSSFELSGIGRSSNSENLVQLTGRLLAL